MLKNEELLIADRVVKPNRKLVSRKLDDMHRRVVKSVFKEAGTWSAVQALVDLKGYVKTSEILGVSIGYLHVLLNSNSEKLVSSKIIERIKRRLEAYLQIISI